jgi:iron(II)-dependent oxidoreductase
VKAKLSSICTFLRGVPRQNFAWGAVGVGGALLLWGAWSHHLLSFGLGAASLVAGGVAITGWRPTRKAAEKVAPPHTTAVEPFTPAPRTVVAPEDTTGLVEQMLAQGRYALMLRPKVVNNLSPAHRDRTRDELTEQMAFVPAGEVGLSHTDDGAENAPVDSDYPAAVFRVDAYYLDRYPVSNRQFLEFVMAGGYEQMALWDAKILPAVIDFVDQSGCLGPRYWRHGRYHEGTEDQPVIGLSWYEAMAYARWVGKRLPTDAEWVKAACWPVPLGPGSRMQRRYPWGDNMDRSRANIWGSGPGKIVPVTEFGSGVSVGGVYQLIGNVWEWTSSNFGAGGYSRPELVLPSPMKSLRGGAFDTYFDNQATCQFQSGENPVARRYNIGFRCAMGACDVSFSDNDDVAEAETAAAEAELQEAGA